MTEKTFKNAMRKGLGRCILELKNTDNIEKYRNAVMWACRNELAYDPQCEGYRSLYLYEMICMFPDVMPFLEVIKEGLYKNCGKDMFEFAKDCEVLLYFARDCEKYIEELFEEFYNYLYGRLLKKRKWDSAWIEVQSFECMCVLFIEHTENRALCKSLYHKIVCDMGRLIKNNKLYSDFGFDWFESVITERFGKKAVEKIFEKYAEKDDGLDIYRTALQKAERSREEYRKAYINEWSITADELCVMLSQGRRVGREIPMMLIRRMCNNGNHYEVEKLARYYENEQNEDIRAQILDLFSSSESSDLLNVDMVIADSASENEKLKECAFWTLREIKNDKVHDLALALIDDEEYITDVAIMIANNYKESDREIFVKLVKSIPVVFDETYWHTVFSRVIDMFEDKTKRKLPNELLLYMYENGFCSCCRERIVKQMGKRRMLTDEIIEECLYDSSNAIREYSVRKSNK